MIPNCPTNYYNNCSVADLRCNGCAAFNSVKTKLQYLPLSLDPDLSIHPYSLQIDTVNKQNRLTAAKAKLDKKLSKRSPSKQGYDSERELTTVLNNKINKQITVIKSTVGSGKVNKDGDHHLLNGLIRSDHKLRIKCQSFTVSKEEYLKGLTQDINQFVITNQLGRVYVLTESLYIDLIAKITYLEDQLKTAAN